MQDRNEQEQIESRGATIEEAVSEALLMLGARRDEVEIEVIDEPKSGVFGVFGKRQARVRVTRRRKRTRGRRGGRRSRGGGGQGPDKRDAQREAAPQGERGDSRRGGRDGSPRGGRGGSSDGGRRDEAPRGRRDEAPRGRRDEAPRGRRDEAPRGRRDEAPRGRRDEAPRGRRDEAPRGRRDEAPRGRREEAPRSDAHKTEKPHDRRPEPVTTDSQDSPRREERPPRRRPPRRRPGSQPEQEREQRPAPEAAETPRPERTREPRAPRREEERRPEAPTPVAESSLNDRTEQVESRQTGEPVAAVSLVEPTRGLSESDAAEVQRSMAEELMQRSGFACRCTVVEDEYNQVKVIADTDSAAVLIGRRGSTIDAVEHLVDRMANQAIDAQAHMNLDINNYRHRREGQLTENALDAVRQVKETSEDLHTPPLCARERRIVHLAVEKIDGVTTHTAGFGPDRHVVVTLDDKDHRQDDGDQESQPVDETPVDTATVDAAPVKDETAPEDTPDPDPAPEETD